MGGGWSLMSTLGSVGRGPERPGGREVESCGRIESGLVDRFGQAGDLAPGAPAAWGARTRRIAM